MAASDYVRTYLNLQCKLKDSSVSTRVRNYLQSGLGHKSETASRAYSQLMTAAAKLPDAGGKRLSDSFQIQGTSFVRHSLQRVFIGKGAPNEIQDAIYLASLCDLVDETNINQYCDDNLGIDCGGFVANYWGLGRPNGANANPTGADGFKPRTIWGMFPGLRRKSAADIQPDDAGIFFKDVKGDDPNIVAKKGSDGKYDATTGSQAFHIAVVSAITPGSGNTINLEIAESSGAIAASGGNGVNVRNLGQVTASVAKGFVYCMDGKNRIYFTGQQGSAQPYMPNA